MVEESIDHAKTKSPPKSFMVAVINPGGTSTKVACFVGERERFFEDLRHEPATLERFATVYDQLDWRLEQVRACFARNGVSLDTLDAVIGRGGPVAPVKSGTYLVDEPLLAAVRENRVMVVHPSLLGAPLAHGLAAAAGHRPPAYVADPVSVDELIDAARLTGLPEIPRRALSHALSVKAAARRAAARLGRPLEALNLVVVHLGSGTTVAAQKGGRQVDATDASASGPMAPTRTGSLPALDLAKLCFCGKYTLNEIKKLLVGGGGWKAHLGTDDIRQIYALIDAGEPDSDGGGPNARQTAGDARRARLVLDATLLQIAKETAAMAAVLDGRLDAVVLTGGVVRAKRFVAELKPRLTWLCDEIFVFAGDDEMRALADRGVRALRAASRVARGEKDAANGAALVGHAADDANAAASDTTDLPRSMAPYIEAFNRKHAEEKT